MDIETLQDMAAWARSRVTSGEEPPWTYKKLQDLNEVCAELAACMMQTSTTVSDQDNSQTTGESSVESRDGFGQRHEAKIVVLDSFRTLRDTQKRASLTT